MFKNAALTCKQACPLCHTLQASLFYQDNNKRSQRPYYQCGQCRLVFVPMSHYLTSEQEKAEYDLHENLLQDEGYKQFLQRFWQPFKKPLPISATILEFGCGPGPALADLMSKEGYQVSLYDHFYYPDTAVLKPNFYDGLSSTEVIEHLHDPKAVIKQWLAWLKPKGVLGVMTKLVKSPDAFASWHYKNDLTHVCFYSDATFQWMAKTYDLSYRLVGADVALFQKQQVTGDR